MGNSAAALPSCPRRSRGWEHDLERPAPPSTFRRGKSPGAVRQYPDANAILRKISATGGGKGIGAILFGKIEGGGVLRINGADRVVAIKGNEGKNGARVLFCRV